MNKGLGRLATVAYFIVLPYLSRVGGGMAWVAQYLPPPDKLLSGLLFFAAFSAIPGIMLVALDSGRKRSSRRPLIIAFVLMSVLTVFFHHDYDLASDAQAAIGLVVVPFYVAGCGLIAFFLTMVIEWLWTRASRLSTGQDT